MKSGRLLLSTCLLAVPALLILQPALIYAQGEEATDDAYSESGDDVTQTPEVASARQEAASSLLWGTYRPQIYFGMRPRLPNSFLSGLAWVGLQDYTGVTNIRHQCSDQDGMKGFTWKYHDGREFGIQEINDNRNNYRLETSFLKVDTSNPNGGSWGARVSGTVIDPSKPAALSAFWYTALENHAGTLDLDNEVFSEGLERGETVKLVGSTGGLGAFVMRVEEPGADHGNANNAGNEFIPAPHHYEQFSETAGKAHFLGKAVQSQQVWRSKDVLQNDLIGGLKDVLEKFERDDLPSPTLTLKLSNTVEANSNFYALQKSFTGNFTFDIFYDSATTPRGELLSSAGLTRALSASREAYDRKFQSALQLRAKGYSEKEVNFARDLTSSIAGGIGYFHGTAVVDRSRSQDYDADEGVGFYDPESQTAAEPEKTDPAELFTATPCRNIFPRGFYWDEGFHLAHIGAIDNDLSLDILRSWIDLIDEDGWVAREQILGDEARSRVPDGFQTQNSQYGNPPTLILAVQAYVNRLISRNAQLGLDPSALGQQVFTDFSTAESAPLSEKMLASAALGQAFLKDIYPKLRRHYLWFRRTQRGEIRQWGRQASSRLEAYRWRGRTKDHVLASGLDDYPRAPAPHSGELHVDLMSWMGSFADTMTNIARVLGKEDDVEEFEGHYADVVANLDDLHWNEEKKMYCDASVNEQDETFHVCHAGYVSLFPLMLELLPTDSPHLEDALSMLRDPDQLWSAYGIRSLSLKDEFFGASENYWRGPIWVHMSYLTLRALRNKYATTSGPYQAQAKEIYDQLRDNVVRNTFSEYQRTGYVYEQYNPKDGRGQRGHPFTGWTSTVALMMAEIYP